MDDFLGKLSEAIEKQRRGQKDPEADWDEHDYEKFMRECDARTEKFGELLDKYGHSEEAQEKIAREMGWDSSDDDWKNKQMSVEDTNALCDAADDEPSPEPNPEREGIDWIRLPDGDLRHPLQHRCFESGMRFWQQIDELGLGEWDDTDLAQFIGEFQTTGIKLAGALNGIAEGRDCRDDAFTVAYLKRALDHLHKSQAGLEAVAPKNLLPERVIADARKELFEIREGILKLMDDFRGRR
jgi:hypothetical protein